jgi:hypothetical protein
VAFLEHIVSSQPGDREIHVIADNLLAHKTMKVTAFLRRKARPVGIYRSSATYRISLDMPDTVRSGRATPRFST